MKTKILLIAVLFALVANIHAITFADIAGVYNCKRTENFSDHVGRYDEILVITPDGYIANFVTLPSGQVTVFEGFLEMDKDGNIVNAGGLSGYFKGNGNHIEVVFIWSPDLYRGGVTIAIGGEQTGDNWDDLVPQQTEHSGGTGAACVLQSGGTNEACILQLRSADSRSSSVGCE